MTGQITVVGNLGEDPTLRYTQKGQAVLSVSIADTPRHLDRATDTWSDGETMWYRGEMWDAQAENASKSLKKGDRVIAHGTLVANAYESREGEKKVSTKFKITEIGPSLLRATVSGVQRTTGNGGGNGGNRSGNNGGGNRGGYSAPAQASDSGEETPF
jgi:single-strand DNA-binding protein